MFLKNEFSNRLVQVSLFSAFVYYITAYPVVFESARKYFPIKFKKTHNLLIFHTFVFAVLMYLLTYFVFDPIVRVVEGVGPHAKDIILADSATLGDLAAGKPGNDIPNRCSQGDFGDQRAEFDDCGGADGHGWCMKVGKNPQCYCMRSNGIGNPFTSAGLNGGFTLDLSDITDPHAPSTFQEQKLKYLGGTKKNPTSSRVTQCAL